MARKKGAVLLVEVLAKAGVRQIYGVSGDSLNGITDSIRATKQIQWIHVRHETPRESTGILDAAHDHSRANEGFQPFHAQNRAQRSRRRNRRSRKKRIYSDSPRKAAGLTSA
jgi:hypothetical protein